MDIDISTGDDSNDDDGKPGALTALRRRLASGWTRLKRIMRSYGWYIVSFGLVFGYSVAIVAGHHDPAKWEKIMWLALPSGAILFLPGTIYAVYKLWDKDWYFYDKVRGDDSESPREIWKANEAAHRRMSSKRHTPERPPGTLNPTFEIMDIDPENMTVTPTYRGKYSDPDSLRRNREEIGRLWDAVDEDGRMWRAMRDYFPAIIRSLDRDRAVRQAQAVEKHTIPEIQGDTIDDVITDTVPDDLLPDSVLNNGSDDLETEMEEKVHDVAKEAVADGGESDSE